jgi:hypothetical protein
MLKWVKEHLHSADQQLPLLPLKFFRLSSTSHYTPGFK